MQEDKSASFLSLVNPYTLKRGERQEYVFTMTWTMPQAKHRHVV